MQEQTLKQLKSTCDSIPSRNWRVRPVDDQAKPAIPPDSKYHHGTQTEGEEWYADQTIIRHSSS